MTFRERLKRKGGSKVNYRLLWKLARHMRYCGHCERMLGKEPFVLCAGFVRRRNAYLSASGEVVVSRQII